MTAESSIDPAGFLHEHLALAGPDLLRELMQGFINTLLPGDADSVCVASSGPFRWAGRAGLVQGCRPGESSPRMLRHIGVWRVPHRGR